ncbi:MAG TPA: hypothetical protein VHZ96_27560, partial [Frankiaceae bacterium]|nr:hypothetical protein [Frankiaceae bacterium]
MRKSRAVRVAGFVGALGASAALVGFAATGTGAYFSDSHPGAINASTGSVKVNVNPADGNLNFTNLLPGEYQTQQVQYQATGTGSEDIWLVFPTTGGAGGTNPSELFTGNPSDAAGGGLGRFGHLAVDAPAGSFTSYNLNNPGTGSHSGSTCGIDGNGHGGSNQQAASRADTTLIPFCAPANAILLSSGLTTGQADAATITFGYTPLVENGQGAPL